MILIQILRVSGHSLHPTYQDGDFVIVSKIPILIRGTRVRDIILFNHPVYGKMLKRVQRIEPDAKLYVMGENPDSVDSRRFGPIPPGWVSAVVLWHVKAR